jgi:hypothetical protein
MLKDQLLYLSDKHGKTVDFLRQVPVRICDEWFDNEHVVECLFGIIRSSCHSHQWERES